MCPVIMVHPVFETKHLKRRAKFLRFGRKKATVATLFSTHCAIIFTCYKPNEKWLLLANINYY